MSHSIARQIHVLSEDTLVSIIICECGDKFRGRSTEEASRKQWTHMIAKERDE